MASLNQAEMSQNPILSAYFSYHLANLDYCQNGSLFSNHCFRFFRSHVFFSSSTGNAADPGQSASWNFSLPYQSLTTPVCCVSLLFYPNRLAFVANHHKYNPQP